MLSCAMLALVGPLRSALHIAPLMFWVATAADSEPRKPKSVGVALLSEAHLRTCYFTESFTEKNFKWFHNNNNKKYLKQQWCVCDICDSYKYTTIVTCDMKRWWNLKFNKNQNVNIKQCIKNQRRAGPSRLVLLAAAPAFFDQRGVVLNVTHLLDEWLCPR